MDSKYEKMRKAGRAALVFAVAAAGQCLFPRPSWAYIDPGTSGFIFSFLGPILAAVAGVLAIFFRPILNLLKVVWGKMKEKPLLFGPLLLAVLGGAGLLVWSSFFSTSSNVGSVYMEAKSDKKVLFLGLDGLDPKIINRLLDNNELPNFARLRQEGSYDELATSNPPQSPVAWSCMASGANPGQHGIYDFIKRNPKNYLPDLAIVKFNRSKAFGDMFSPVREGVAFWEVTAGSGIPSKIIRWPITFPPKKSKATVFAGLGVPDIKGTLGHYTFYTTGKPDPEDPAKYKVVELSPGKDGLIKAEIIGPPVSGITKKNAKVPFTLRVGDKQVEIMIGEQSMTVKEGDWSEWVQLQFSVGIMKKVSGIGKFYLVQTNPELKLYLSPLQTSPLDPAFPITNPESYAAELVEPVGMYHTLGMPEDTNALSEGRFDEAAFLKSCDEIMREREKMLLFELSRFKEGLLAFVIDTSDRIQHMFWRFEEPELFDPPPDLQAMYKNAVEDMYRHMDQILGTVMRYVDKDTTLLICSDHGFTSYKRSVHVNSWLVQNGYMALKGAAGKGKDDSLFANVDWSKTKAYSLGFGSIYLNLKGREGKGIVATSEADGLLREIRDGLLQLKDPQSDAPVVKDVYLAKEIYSGPYLENSPDLVVGCYPGYRFSWQTAIGGTPEGLFDDNVKPWSGDHCVDPGFVPGIIFSNKSLKSENPRIIDVAPTVLQVFGLPIPDSMEGKPLL